MKELLAMPNMTLSEELTWRGLVNQTTYPDLKALDGKPIGFYWGVDPSADSMTVGNLAAAMMVRHFIRHGHKAVLLVGGATGLIGDPDGKKSERGPMTATEIARNKQAIVAQYRQLFQGLDFKVVDNADWFKSLRYLDFLRDVGKHVPMRQMLARDFVQSRLGASGTGISYAEFSYVLIQAYDFLHLHQRHGVDLQVSGADQWGNCIAGVDLIRRKTGDEAHVFSTPLVTDQTTGVKFGKTETGAVWLDPTKTTPTEFYQFWINTDDASVGGYLKIFTELDKPEIARVMTEHTKQPGQRLAQTRLAQEVTRLVHGQKHMDVSKTVTEVLIGRIPVGDAGGILTQLRAEIPAVKTSDNGSIIEALSSSGLATSNTEARRLINDNAISLNGQRVSRDNFEPSDFQNGRLLIRRGKAFKDSVLVELS